MQIRARVCARRVGADDLLRLACVTRGRRNAPTQQRWEACAILAIERRASLGYHLRDPRSRPFRRYSWCVHYGGSQRNFRCHNSRLVADVRGSYRSVHHLDKECIDPLSEQANSACCGTPGCIRVVWRTVVTGSVSEMLGGQKILGTT